MTTSLRNAPPTNRTTRTIALDTTCAKTASSGGHGFGSRPLLVASAATLAMTLSAPAHAYVGPGAGLGVIGTLFGIVAAILLAMFGLLWYPLKRAFGKKGASDGTPSPTSSARTVAHDPVANVENGPTTADRVSERRDGSADAHIDARNDERRPS